MVSDKPEFYAVFYTAKQFVSHIDVIKKDPDTGEEKTVPVSEFVMGPMATVSQRLPTLDRAKALAENLRREGHAHVRIARFAGEWVT